MIDETKIKTKTLYKALKVLDCFTVKTPELGITEISEKLELYKSNVHNIMDTFVKAGYLIKNPENGKYKLALRILELGNVISSNMSFRKTILPHMQELADSTGETIYLGVPSEEGVLYLDSSSPRDQMITKSVMGIKAPFYCTGIGKAMLAYMTEEQIQSALPENLHRFTDCTITDRQALLKDLYDIRLRGYAIDNMEHQFGIKCVGAAIRNNLGEVIAGLSISGPSLRFDEENIIEHAKKLQATIGNLGFN